MKSPFHDPQNHVPEVSEGDHWGDGNESAPGNPSALPGKRIGGKPQGRSAVEKDLGPALRIEPQEPEVRPAVDSPVRLEVQELGKGQAGEPKAAPVPVVPRQAIEAMEPLEPAPDWRPGAGEGREWGKQPEAGSNRWMIHWGLGILVLLIAGMALKPVLDQRHRVSRTVHTGVLELEVLDDMPTTELASDDPLLILETDARRVFGEFVKARTLDEALPLIRDGEDLKEKLIAEWQPRNLPQSWSPREEIRMQTFQNEGLHYGVASGMLPDFKFSEAYLVVVGDRVLVDWEASTARGTATFEELRRGEGDPSFIRVALSPTDFYTDAYPESEYQAFLLTEMDPDSLLWAYARRGGPVERQIAELFTPGMILRGVQKEYRLCLRLERGPDGSLPKQWLIGELLHMDWVRP